MYHVRVITGENVVVEHHMRSEPIDSRQERELLNDREDHWLDIERIPFDHRTDYVLETADEFSESDPIAERVADFAPEC